MGDLFKFLFWISVGLVVALVVSEVITMAKIKKAAKERAQNAFKLEILEKKKTAVKVGIFDRLNERIDTIEITGDKVSNNIISGQVIYI